MEELSTREKMQVLDFATRHPENHAESVEDRFKKMAALVADTATVQMTHEEFKSRLKQAAEIYDLLGRDSCKAYDLKKIIAALDGKNPQDIYAIREFASHMGQKSL